MKPPRLRRLAASAAPVVGLLLLTGCGTLAPGTAAVVDGSSISKSQVDELASAQCDGVEASAKQGGGQSVSRQQLNQRALGLLIDIKLNLAYGKSLGLEPRPADVQGDLTQVRPLIASLPAKYHDALTTIFEDWADGRDMVAQVGEKATGQQRSASTDDALLNAGYQQRATWLKKVTIDTDPVYAPSKAGWPGEGDSSVSKPVSSFAKGAAASQQAPTFIASLPASQRCG